MLNQLKKNKMKTKKALKVAQAATQTFNIGSVFADQVASKMAYHNRAINELQLSCRLTFEAASEFIEKYEDAFTLNRVMGMSASENAFDLFNAKMVFAL